MALDTLARSMKATKETKALDQAIQQLKNAYDDVVENQYGGDRTDEETRLRLAWAALTRMKL